MSAIDLVKKHPLITAVGAVVIIGGAFLLFGGSASSSEESGPMTVPFPNGNVTADNSNLAAQLQLQSLKVAADNANQQISAQKEISLADIQKQITIAQYQKDTAFHVADLTATTAQLDIAAKKAVSTLSLNNQKFVSTIALKNQSDKQIYDYKLATKSIQTKALEINAKKLIELKKIEADVHRTNVQGVVTLTALSKQTQQKQIASASK